MKQIHAVMNRVHNMDLGILLIRIAIGIVFIHAGWLKIMNIDAIVGGFGMMGIPAFLAYFVSYAEFIGGMLLVIGLGVRYVGVVLAIIMLVAFYTVHLPNGYGLANNGFEYVLTLGLSAVALVVMGAGKYSADRKLGC